MPSFCSQFQRPPSALYAELHNELQAEHLDIAPQVFDEGVVSAQAGRDFN